VLRVRSAGRRPSGVPRDVCGIAVSGARGGAVFQPHLTCLRRELHPERFAVVRLHKGPDEAKAQPISEGVGSAHPLHVLLERVDVLGAVRTLGAQCQPERRYHCADGARRGDRCRRWADAPFDNSSIALKNSSIIRSTHDQHQHRMQLAEQAARATSTPKAFVWIWLLQMAWRANNSTFTISNEQLRAFEVHRNFEGTREGGADPGLKGRKKGSPRDPALPSPMPWLGHVHALAGACACAGWGIRSYPYLLSLVSLESTGGRSSQSDQTAEPCSSPLIAALIARSTSLSVASASWWSMRENGMVTPRRPV